ncbi:hypothetical protein CANCADRAFT_44538 [Tortispora caseinolytica NRRL Y-17796]|uniref:precorrin-2 dehydrogenase n=1 Tax=Tortispora caseinolytica NRRL Y-17796 TaxID=767744 RepID=A0A1E4TGN5_9ASCO|nr:hypothetical protein CANCADRAFT_44538 [Tortispora caseinolytica NRRL Y-17796]
MTKSLLIAWQTANKLALVIGGGSVAYSRVRKLLDAEARVRVVSPTLEKELSDLETEIEYVARKFVDSDLDDEISMVLVAIDDHQESSRIYKLCKERGVPVNVADVPEECDFYFGANYDDGPLQVLVSTNGESPGMASYLGKYIASHLPPHVRETIEMFGEMRRRLRSRFPGPEHSKFRMRLMKKLTQEYRESDPSTVDIDGVLDKYTTESLNEQHPTRP